MGAMSTHSFDAALALQAQGEGRWFGHTHPDWGNMVGPFGGITAAHLLQAVMLDPRALGEPLALTVNFASGVADGPFEIEAQPSRTNRSTQHWQMTLRQAGSRVHHGQCRVRGAPADLVGARAGHARRCHRLRRWPWRHAARRWPGRKRYELRFVEGGWPDYRNPQDLPESRTVVWMRDQPPRPLDAPSLAAIADVFYPRVFRRRQRFTPAGTVSITTYFHADRRGLCGAG
jgi:hypothetical protein